MSKQSSVKGYDKTFRPTRLEDLVLSKENLALLKSLIKNFKKDGKLPSTVGLFGESGRGKTTIARILGIYLNCETYDACGKCKACKINIGGRGIVSSPSYKEFNSADVGIEQAKAIETQSNYQPSAGSRLRIMFLDEIHKIKSKPAMDSLLKSLEEPPENTMWIIATNFPDSIPNHKAVMGRCWKMFIGEPKASEVAVLLQNISNKVDKKAFKCITTEQYESIATGSSLQVRDAVKALEMVHDLIMDAGKKPSDKAIEDIISTCAGGAGAIDPQIEELASKLVAGIYCSNGGAVWSAIASTQDHYKLIQQSMFMNKFLMGMTLNPSGRGKGLIYAPCNKNMWSMLKGKGIDPVTIAKVHNVLIQASGDSIAGGVSSMDRLLARLVAAIDLEAMDSDDTISTGGSEKKKKKKKKS